MTVLNVVSQSQADADALDEQAQQLWYETNTKRTTYPASPITAWHTLEQVRKQPWIDKILARKTK